MAEAVAILREQKSTKIIQLLEEMRRDSPHLIDRLDHVAQVMSSSADPQAVFMRSRTSTESCRCSSMALPYVEVSAGSEDRR